MKQKRGKRIGALALSITCLAALWNPIPVRAEQYWPTEPDVGAHSAVVIEVNTGTVLYEKNGTDHLYPASITKIMTTMLAIENCGLDETVVFSYDAVYGGNEGNTSHIARNMNEELTLEQCLYAVMLESANECAYATAEHVAETLGGDYRSFIDLMNERAKELGCENTHFNNANGLPDEDHWTCAKDMALIAAEAYRNETFRTITGSKSYTIPITNKCPEPYYCHNHHKMIYPWQGDRRFINEYCTGGKTGYTVAAGNTLVSFAEKDGLVLAVCVMNAGTDQHYKSTQTLFDYCFDHFQAVNIAENEASLSSDGLENAGVLNNNKAFVTIDKNSYIVLPKNVEFEEASYSLQEDVDDSTIATLAYTYAGRPVGSASIVTSNVVAEENFLEREEVVEDPEVTTILVKPIYIVMGVLLLGVLGVLIYFGKKLYDNFYVIRHNIEMKHIQRSRFRVKNQKRRPKRRKKDRLFK